MNKKITIKTIEQQKHAVACVLDLPFDPVHVVTIAPDKESITSKQRRLWFKWMGEIADKFGEDKNDAHLRYKKQYLIDIYRRDDPEFNMMLEAVNQVYRGGNRTDGELLKDYIIKKTSITDASKVQMSELLKLVEVDATMKGVSLTNPDLYGLVV
jgi:hypothetical protein